MVYISQWIPQDHRIITIVEPLVWFSTMSLQLNTSTTNNKSQVCARLTAFADLMVAEKWVFSLLSTSTPTSAFPIAHALRDCPHTNALFADSFSSERTPCWVGGHTRCRSEAPPRPLQWHVLRAIFSKIGAE